MIDDPEKALPEGADDESLGTEEEIDDALEDSFPASDPPAWPSRSREESDPAIEE